MARVLFVMVGSGREKVRLMVCSGGKQFWELANRGFFIVGLERVVRFSKAARVALLGG